MARRLVIFLMAFACAGTWGAVPASASTGWVIQPTPNPTGAADSRLAGVSCPSASACTAVGEYSVLSGNPPVEKRLTLAERWNGTRWVIQPTPNPTGAEASSLSAVSCTSASACTAVGTTVSGALAERWNGTAWKIQSVPNRAGGTSVELAGVKCTSATACTAVGQYVNGSGVEVTLAERWNGTSWKVQSTPNPRMSRPS